MRSTIVFWTLLCSLASAAVLPELNTVKHLRGIDTHLSIMRTPTPTTNTNTNITLNKRKVKEPASLVAPEIPATCAASAKPKRITTAGCGQSGTLENPGKSPQHYAAITEQNCIDICICAEKGDACQTIAWERNGASNLGSCTLYKKTLDSMSFVRGGQSVFYQRGCWKRSVPLPTHTALPNYHPEKARRSAVDNYVIGALAL